MGDLGLVLHLTRYGLIATARIPRTVVFNIVFPILLLVLFNSIFAHGSNQVTDFPGGTISLDAYFTAGITAYAITMSAFSSLAISLTSQRESGQLKRLRGTPMPAWVFVSAQILRVVVLVVLMVVVLLAIGHFAFDVDLRGETLPGLVLYVVLGTATMCTLGIALTAVTPTADAASTVAPFGALVLSFISGVFIPVDTLPDWLAEVGRVFPLAHLAEGLQTTLSPSATGIGLSAGNVAVLAAWGIGGLVVAARAFRWEPRGAG